MIVFMMMTMKVIMLKGMTMSNLNFSIQVALVDVLKTLGIEPDGIVGHSVGEVGCAYADGAMTADETVLAAYWRGRCVAEAKLPAGGMAAVGKTIQSSANFPQGPKGGGT